MPVLDGEARRRLAYGLRVQADRGNRKRGAVSVRRGSTPTGLHNPRCYPYYMAPVSRCETTPQKSTTVEQRYRFLFHRLVSNPHPRTALPCRLRFGSMIPGRCAPRLREAGKVAGNCGDRRGRLNGAPW